MEAQIKRDRPARARDMFLHHDGLLRTRDALRSGIHPETLYGMRNSGSLISLGRGLYRLSDLPPLGNPTSRFPRVECGHSIQPHPQVLPGQA